MIEFHSFFPSKKWPFQSQKQIQREAHIVGNGEHFQNDIDDEIELAEGLFVGSIPFVENKEIEDL